jgi:hypothetical protein
MRPSFVCIRSSSDSNWDSHTDQGSFRIPGVYEKTWQYTGALQEEVACLYIAGRVFVFYSLFA